MLSFLSSSNEPALALFVPWTQLSSHQAHWALNQVPVGAGTVLAAEILEAWIIVPDLTVAPPLWVGDGVKSLGV